MRWKSATGVKLSPLPTTLKAKSEACLHRRQTGSLSPSDKLRSAIASRRS
ncbi:hypothetical protein KCP69_20520 [Salmonella enterica subsp. enterica]|nr:hypothetical protein KCP69_20520 [Salmonella enterica subsp. enterica]